MQPSQHEIIDQNIFFESENYYQPQNIHIKLLKRTWHEHSWKIDTQCNRVKSS